MSVVGSWKDGKRNGPGFLQTSDGFVYDCMWAQNAMEGRGIATYPSGERYEGLLSNGRREGRGTVPFTLPTALFTMDVSATIAWRDKEP
jgi:hypothetical protein